MNICPICQKPCRNLFCSLEHYRIAVKNGTHDSSMKGKKQSKEVIESLK